MHRSFQTKGIILSANDLGVAPTLYSARPFIVIFKEKYLEIDGRKIPYSNVEAVLQNYSSLFGKAYSLIITDNNNSYTFRIPSSQVKEGLPFKYIEETISFENVMGNIIGKRTIIIFVLLALYFVIEIVNEIFSA